MYLVNVTLIKSFTNVYRITCGDEKQSEVQHDCAVYVRLKAVLVLATV